MTASSSVLGTRRRGTTATASVTRVAPSMLAMVHPAAVVILMQRWLVKGLVETEK
jgi:ABC-type glycerol-3-phosphate transport system permease component